MYNPSIRRFENTSQNSKNGLGKRSAVDGYTAYDDRRTFSDGKKTYAKINEKKKNIVFEIRRRTANTSGFGSRSGREKFCVETAGTRDGRGGARARGSIDEKYDRITGAY